jgi:hypothetical protein
MTGVAVPEARPEEAGSTATVLFCGERYDVPAGAPFTIGRDADLVVDDNPFLHRRLLSLAHLHDLWWLTNTGSRLAATVSDSDGLMQSWLGPGASLPLVLPRTTVLFTAGPTTYEVEVLVPARYTPSPSTLQATTEGSTTAATPVLTESQFALVLALAEPLLRGGAGGRTEIPSSAEAARRLGWALTRFNRKLDNVCQKLARSGVRGLHGGPGSLASGRRARLVEYAVASRLVTREHLYLLDVTSGTEKS